MECQAVARCTLAPVPHAFCEPTNEQARVSRMHSTRAVYAILHGSPHAREKGSSTRESGCDIQRFHC